MDRSEDGTYVRPRPVGGRQLPILSSARLLTRGVPPEVVFGTLHRFGVPFAPLVEELLTSPRPPSNAVHAVSAAALAAGGSVWTPNIDMAVEDAFAASESSRVGVDRLVAGDPRVARDGGLGQGAPPAYVKFHGSADMPGTLAFTDLELLPWFSAEDAARFGATAAGKRVVLYGYRGADIDLRPLLHAAFEQANDVCWYEPSEETRGAIRRVFGDAVRFDPPGFDSSDFADRLRATADSFLAAADEAGLTSAVSDPLREALGSAGRRRPVVMRFDPEPPAVVHARLVERFARARDEDSALAAARRKDLFRVRPRAVAAHARWALSRSLYRDGVLGKAVLAAAARPAASARLPSRARRVVDDKAGLCCSRGGGTDSSRRWRAGRWPAEQPTTGSEPARTCTTWRTRRGTATSPRAPGSYLTAPGRCWPARGEAATPSGTPASCSSKEPSRCTRAGRPTRCARASSSTKGRGCTPSADGRAGGGGWLGAPSCTASGLRPVAGRTSRMRRQLSRARDHIDEAEALFVDASLNAGLGDVRIARLLLARLALAVTGQEQPPPAAAALSGRQQQDAALLEADRLIALGRCREAETFLRRVAERPANAVARDWARLGLAELTVIAGDPAEGLVRIADRAEAGGALWLAAQARLGASSRGAGKAPDGAFAVGEPRVLWMLS